MKIKKLITYTHLTVIFFSFALIAHGAAAAEVNKEEKILENISKEGQTAMREIRWGRVAIFDGDIKQAKDLLDKSKKTLTEVQKQAPELVVTVKSEEKVDGKTVSNQKMTKTKDLVPIDAGLVLSEDFVPTPEKSEKIKQANEHLKQHNTKKAIEVLREADIDISISRVLMPVNDTLNHVDKAIGLLAQNKFYEANLALKAAEDGLIVDSVLLHEPLPASAKESAKANKENPKK